MKKTTKTTFGVADEVNGIFYRCATIEEAKKELEEQIEEGVRCVGADFDCYCDEECNCKKKALKKALEEVKSFFYLMQIDHFIDENGEETTEEVEI